MERLKKTSAIEPFLAPALYLFVIFATTFALAHANGAAHRQAPTRSTSR